MYSAFPAIAETGKPAGDGLAVDREIGRDAEALGRAAERQPETGDDLIEDEERAGLRRRGSFMPAR